MVNNHLQFHKGFTLIETLFAILIFSSALIALMTIASKGISATADAEQTTTASYLAQEGVEVARNMRDTNYATNNAWDAGISSCTAGAPCKILYGTGSAVPTLVACTPLSGIGVQSLCAEHVMRSPLGYTDTGTSSQYTRTVYVVPETPVVSANGTTIVNEYKIVSQVTWVSKTIPHIVILNTILKDWH
jgi:prepilin-type N-terminal cleavage/methylation domain-containing protein